MLRDNIRRSVAFRFVRRLVDIYDHKRPCPSRHRIWNYVFQTPQASANIFLILAGEDYVTDAAWAAASFLSNSNVISRGMRLVFCLDGNPHAALRRKLCSTFPHAMVVSTDFVLDALNSGPITRFARIHPLGGKLAALCYFNRHATVLYSDSDVLAFSRVDAIDTAVGEDKPVFMCQAAGESYDSRTANAAFERGYALSKNLNSGLLLCPAGSFMPQDVEELIPGAAGVDRHSSTWWWIEQTVIAALMARIDGCPLPVTSYVASVRRQFPFEVDVDYTSICARHFISPVRHLMHLKGTPAVLAKCSSQWHSQD